MNQNIKTIGLIALVVAGTLLGLKSIITNDSGSEIVSSQVSADNDNGSTQLPVDLSKAKKLDPGAEMPSNHPPLVPPGAEQQVISSSQSNSKFTHFNVGNRNVKSMHAEKNVVWVGTSGGLIRYDTNTDQHRLFNVDNGLLANGIFYVGRLNDQLAIGTYGGGLALYDEKTDNFDIINVPEGLADAFVYDALQMPNGDIWIATWSGANKIVGGDLKNPDAWETHTVASTNGGLPNDWVYGLALGKDNELWLATEGGLSRHKDGKWQAWGHPEGVGAAYDLVKDDNKFMTDPAQVSDHHARQKVEMNLEHVTTAYNPNYIVALEVDADGTVWVGTWGAGLAHFDGEKWTNHTMKDGLPANHIFMLHRDANNVMWIGTSQGMAVRQNERFGIMTAEQGLFNNVIFSMDTQPDGTMWVGSFGGVARIRP